MRSLTLLVLISAMTIGMAGEVRAENPTAPIRIRGYCVDEQGKGIAGAVDHPAKLAMDWSIQHQAFWTACILVISIGVPALLNRLRYERVSDVVAQSAEC